MATSRQELRMDAYPRALRPSAWSEFLAGLRLAPAAPGAERIDESRCHSGETRLGSRFTVLAAAPQVLHCAGLQQRAAVVLVLLLQGEASIVGEEFIERIGPETLVLLEAGMAWKLALQTPARLLLCDLHEVPLLARLVRAQAGQRLRLAAETGLDVACRALLQTIAESLASVSSENLTQMELALSGLLAAAAGATPRPNEDEHAASSLQLSHLQRICSAIESRLADPALALKDVAQAEKVSPRYVQKLLALNGTTFGDYLRERRLTRCKLELEDKSFSHLSVSQIAFRWGFSDAANFSRAFSRRFGATPKECRHPERPEQPVLRGRPKGRQWERANEDAFAAPDGGVQSERDHTIPATRQSVHWGYFSRELKPVASIASGEIVTIETLTQHAYDDYERMIAGDADAEGVFLWTAQEKGIDCRGSGPLAASIYGRGAGEGFGVHICTGPVYIEDAMPGDVLEVRILEVEPRPSRHPAHQGRCFGSNAAAWWGFHYDDLLTRPKRREVITIYEIMGRGSERHAQALYSFRWTPQKDPFGVEHQIIDYPGIPVDHSTITKKTGVLDAVRIPVRPHFGVLAVAPACAGRVDSVPPGYFGGNIDNWRAGAGTTLYLPVAVPGALFSVGDPHASQGDAEISGTAIECSLTGKFQFILHKKEALEGSFLRELDFPLLETENEWLISGFSYSNYLDELGENAQAEIYKKASLELAMRDAVRKTRRFLMVEHGLDEDEAISLMSVAVDFGVTQVANGNWGIHAGIKKALFSGRKRERGGAPEPEPLT